MHSLFPVTLHHRSLEAFHTELPVHTAWPDGFVFFFTRSVTKAQLKGLWGREAGHKHKHAHRIPPGSCRAQSHRLCSWRWWGNLTLANVAHLHSRYPIRLRRLFKTVHAHQWEGCREFWQAVLCLCHCIFLFFPFEDIFFAYNGQTSWRRCENQYLNGWGLYKINAIGRFTLKVPDGSDRLLWNNLYPAAAGDKPVLRGWCTR